jgi:hypothetical protein
MLQQERESRGKNRLLDLIRPFLLSFNDLTSEEREIISLLKREATCKDAAETSKHFEMYCTCVRYLNDRSFLGLGRSCL